MHIHQLQFAHPQISLQDDSDQAVAIATRKALFEQLYKKSILVGGAHLPFPGLGYLQKDVVGYLFIPY